MSEHNDTYPPVGGSTAPSQPPTSVNTRMLRNYAVKYLNAGFRCLQIAPQSKRPVPPKWQNLIADVDMVDDWFPFEGSYNLGIICGQQPNGVNLLAIDVDPKSDGDHTWDELCERFERPRGPVHRTPSGGWHVFYDAPLDVCRTTAGLLGPGIDTRGVGGQVLVPPSVVLNHETGEIGFYSGDNQLFYSPVPTLPDFLADLMVIPVPVERFDAVLRHPSTGRGDLDVFGDHWDWIGELEADGWEVSHQRGENLYVTRPGKSTRDGHSGLVHLDDNFLVVWSSNAPAELLRPLRPTQLNRDGSVSWTPWDYFVAVRHGASQVAARAAAGIVLTPITVRDEPSPDGEEPPPPADLFLPTEFYDQRPWMAACRQMAQAVGGSPSAHLLAFLCRWATLIPPGYSIPPINGAPSSFDLLGVIAGTSGSGKTSPMRNAAELLPVSGRKDLRLGLGIGSGEGIIEAFYGIVEFEGDDGKKRRERRKCIAGINFTVSEGMIFAELAGRAGTTHVTRLCDAWSGAALSTANASAETFRHIDVNQYRLSLVMGIQADMAHELMNDTAASQGFVGRLLFAWAEEPRVAPRPRPPDPPTIEIPATIRSGDEYTQTYLDYPDEVYAEIQAANDQRVGTNVPVEEHHHDLLRCKVAGIVALLDGRMFVSQDDWSIATALVATSASVRKHLYAHRLQQRRDLRHSQAEARAEVELVVDDIKERQGIARMAVAIKAAAPGAKGAIRKRVSATSTRHRFEPALALAIANDWVRVEGGRVEENRR